VFLVLNPTLSNGGLPLHYYTKKRMFEVKTRHRHGMLRGVLVRA
jgi:hypothetical protein